MKVAANLTGPAVVVWTTAASPPSALFRVLPSAADGLTTKIQDITFGGAAIGVDAAASSGFNNLTLTGCTFIRNTIGFSAVLTGDAKGTLKVKDPVVKYAGTTASPPPVYQSPSVGLKFWAQENSPGSIPQIRAGSEVTNLTTEGAFPSMSPLAWNQRTSLEDLSTSGTRLVEVFVDGTTDEHVDTPPYAARPIASVELAVNGGVWDGAAAENAGWDVGLYAATMGNRTQAKDYCGGYKVTLSGTTIREFRMAGIHATVYTNSRGEIEIPGNTVIQDTGIQASHAAGGFFYSGAHLFNLEGYLVLDAANSSFSNNRGHGVFLHSNGTLQVEDVIFPMGLFIKSESCDFHNNDGSGIDMEAGTPWAAGGSQGAIVGGTWDWYGGLSLVAGNDSEPASFPEHFGQGVINRADISNNGEYGIRTAVIGNTTGSAGFRSAASVRIVNSYIWNNPGGGYYAAIDRYPLSEAGPWFLVPLQHCTLAGNGSAAAPWTVEVAPTAGTTATFLWTETGTFPPTSLLRTLIRESILERQNSGLGDYGPGIQTVYAPDVPGGVSATSLPVEGVRSVPPVGLVSTSTASPFVGSPIVWTSLDATQFFLSTNAQPWGQSPNFIGVDAPEANSDYRGDTTRPSVASGLRDKGGEEL